MKKALKILVPLVVVGLGVGAAAMMIKFRKQVAPQATEPLPRLVDTVVVRKQDHQFHILTQGTVEPRTEIQLIVEVSGRILEISPSLENGAFFEQGAVLATVDPRDFELAVVQAQARVEEARYRLQLEKAEAEVARAEWDQLGQGDPNPLLLRQPQLAQAQAALAGAEAALEQARRDLDRCRVTAPFDGRVAQKLVDAGQYVTRGTVLGEIYAVDYAEVRLPLASDQLAYVDLPLVYRGETPGKPGPLVLLHARLAGQAHVWTGRVDRVEGKIDPRTRMIFAVARVEDPYGRQGPAGRPPLAAGLFVEAEILGKRVQEAVVLPRAALLGTNEVRVVQADQRLHRRLVSVWRADRGEVVIGAGLENGERVCVSRLEIFVEGMRVRTEREAPAPPAAAAAAQGEEGNGGDE